MVGITGGSGSGKTTLAKALCAAMPENDAVVLPLDAYYHDLSHLDLAARRHQNFDAPEAIDWALFAAHLGTLRRGHHVDRPVYDFTSHTRETWTTSVDPRTLVVAEGLLLLCRADVRAYLDASVFLEVDDHTAVERRIARDCRERDRQPDDIRAQFARDVRPMCEQHVRPTRQWATLTLSGNGPLAASVECVLKALTRDGSPRRDQV